MEFVITLLNKILLEVQFVNVNSSKWIINWIL